MYAKDLNEPKYQFLIEKREYAGIKYKNDPTAYFECSNTMDDVYENIDYYNLKRDRKVLIVFDDITADTITYKIFQAIIKELFIRCKKTKYFTCFYYVILFFCSKRYKIKFYRLFDYESKQQRITKYCN